MTTGSRDRPASILIQRRIEWWDTDASGNYHNTAAARLFESAETLLLGRLGILDDVYGRLPRARVETDFLRPLLFHDQIDVELEVAGIGRTSITYAMEIRRGREPCVRTRLVAVLLNRARGTPVAWPEGYRSMLLTAGPQAPETLPPVR